MHKYEIASVKAAELVLEKQDPKWRFARRASPIHKGVVLRIADKSGLAGYGYASEAPGAGEPLRAAVSAVIALLGSGIETEARTTIAELARNEEIGACKEVLNGVEAALLDLLGKQTDCTASELLGGRRRNAIPLARILALKTPEEMAQNAKILVADGYTILKIKLDNRDILLDAARVKAVRDSVGDAIRLTIDANTSYSAKGAIRLFKMIEGEDIALFEQPVAAHDLRGLRTVREAVSCEVEAHESVSDLYRIHELVAGGFVDCINLTVGRFGVRELLEAAAICQAGSVTYRFGAFGSQIGTAVGAHIASATPELRFGCELAEFARMNGDVAHGLEIKGGMLTVPSQPGLGIEVDDSRLDWLTA